MSLNVCTPLYKPGQDITGHCTAPVVGKTFLDISATIQSGPTITSVNLPATYDGGNIQVATAAAKAKAIGVAAYNQEEGKKVPLLCGAGYVVPVTASGAITAGEEVEVGAEGKAAKLAAGKPVGKAFNTVANGEDCFVRLY